MLRSLRDLESSRMNAAAEVQPIADVIQNGKGWVSAIRGYRVQGRHIHIGDIQDFIVDDQTGDIRYLVVDASDGPIAKRVLVAPHWTHRVSWSERKVHMDFTQEAIQDSPAWDPSMPVTREYEARLYDHYGRPAYWASGEASDPFEPSQQAGRPSSFLRSQNAQTAE